MSIIVPAILPTSQEDLDQKLLALQGIAKHVQIDIVDGRSTGPASWPYTGSRKKPTEISEESFKSIGTLHAEMDLMVDAPEIDIKRFIALGANRIVVHAEIVRTLPQVIESFRTQYGHDKDFAPGLLSFGIGINIGTDIALIEPYLSRCDYVQFMGIERIGKQAQPFDTRVIPKIVAFRKKYPKIPVQVDGGVSLETALALLSAGASRLVVGSALWKAPNLAKAYADFISLTERYGSYV